MDNNALILRQIDVSWDPVEGLELFVNGSSVGVNSQAITNELDYDQTSRLGVFPYLSNPEGVVSK